MAKHQTFDDLSVIRADEETVLAAVYGDDFCKRTGVWGSTILTIHVRPPDTPKERIGSELTLSVQLSNKYPMVVPKIDLIHVRGLKAMEITDLMKILSDTTISLAQSASPMVCELVQLVEDFLWKHNRDPILENRSEWEKMRDKLDEKKRRMKEEEDRIQSFMTMEMAESNDNSRNLVHGNDDSTSNFAHVEDSDHLERVRTELERQKEALFDGSQNQAFLGFDIQNSESFDYISSQGESSSDKDTDEDEDELSEASNNHISSTSRYSSDFIELGVLGKGGGGEVLKVKNRLDRRTYAIKRIHLQPEKGRLAKRNKLHNARLLREVKTISKMTHKNIVRYYQAWVEGSPPNDSNVSKAISSNGKEPSLSSASLNETESSNEASESGWWHKSPLLGAMKGTEIDDDGFGKLDDTSDEDNSSTSSQSSSEPLESSYDSIMYQFERPLLKGFDLQDAYNNMFQKIPERNDDLSMTHSTPRVAPDQGQKIILYIQMEFCATTLRHLIDDGSILNMEQREIWRLIRQTSEALAYVHKLRVIHRDLKPSNIFLDAENNIRLGDFGLATTTPGKHNIVTHTDADTAEALDCKNLIEARSATTGLSSGQLTGGVGTAFYCAPEQEQTIRSRRNTDYDVKADIFSLGIIIFELFHPPFTTLMERAENLVRLRSEHATMKPITLNDLQSNDAWKTWAKLLFSEIFMRNSPSNVQKIIIWCIQRHPEDRPTAEQLLSSDLVPRAIELDKVYLEEALLAISTDSGSRQRILESLFERIVPHHVEVTYDTDMAAKTSITIVENTQNTEKINEIKGSARDSKRSLKERNIIGASAALSALTRAKEVGKVAKVGKEYESLRGVPQKITIALANIAASAAAVTGSMDGIYGADPRVVSFLCTKLKVVFESHGAIHLRPPLLRPRTQAVKPTAGVVEIMNRRGVTLLLPEDLTVNFARAIGRAGGTVSHLKRYDIDKVYQRSISDNHPREYTEASFDIVFDDRSVHPEYFEAECIVVLIEVLTTIRNLFNRKTVFVSESLRLVSPFYYLKLNHVRLAESILDICHVPSKDATRRACYHILSLATCSPIRAAGIKSYAREKETMERDLDTHFANAITRHGLPEESSKRLRKFIDGCIPISGMFLEAISTIEHSIKSLQISDIREVPDAKRLRKYDDVIKGLRSLETLSTALANFGMQSLIDNKNASTTSEFHLPIYLSIDLGLRHRRKLHGPLVFHATILHDDYFQPYMYDDPIGSSKGVVVAEGGRYDDLVLKFSPPGNFISVPMCVGVRFSIGKLVERLYAERLLTSIPTPVDSSISFRDRIESIRNALGHPILKSHPIKCFVASVNGLDTAFLSERAKVCAQLWMNGIPADYLPHSGLIMSFLHKSNVELGQPHLLNDKGSIRLRSLITSHIAQHYTEETIPFSTLALVVKERLGMNSTSSEGDMESKNSIALLPGDRELMRLNSSVGGQSTKVLRLFVENDRYFEKGESVSKQLRKTMTTVIQKADLFLSRVVDSPKIQNGAHLLSVNLPYLVLREFGTNAMVATSSPNYSVGSITLDTINKYPGHERVLKTMGKALDYLFKQREKEGQKHLEKDPMKACHVLLYSLCDDRFDLITLGEPLVSITNVSSSMETAKVSKKEHRKR